jgi:glycosyltransferase involved in cell wall biosynthesis
MRNDENMRLMLFIPMYNCAPQIRRTLGQLTPELQKRFAEVFVLDNGSTDGGPEVVRDMAMHLSHTTVHVARNTDNYGLGGSHKVAFQRCIDEAYDGLVVFHGDDQGHLADLMDVLDDFVPGVDCVLGARFMQGSELSGYAPHRIAANVVFNGIFSAITFSTLWDLGSGLNFYTRTFLERGLWRKCADDLTFNYYLILQTASAPDVRVQFVPISWREDDQVSNAKLFSHGRKMLRIIGQFMRARRTFLEKDHSDFTGTRSYEILGP